MLSYVEAYNPAGQKITLTLGDPANPYQVREISGLGPVPAAINSSSYGGIDGEVYQGSNVGKRNIVLTLKLNPNWATQTVQTLRNTLYGYFMPKSAIRLRFIDSLTPTKPVEIVGYVESNEPTLFSKDPEIQISIICTSPYFYDISTTTLSGTFTSQSVPIPITYAGSVMTGFVLDVTTSGTTTYTGSINMLGVDESGIVNFSVVANITSSKILRVSTVKGKKYARQGPSSNPTTNIMDSINRNALLNGQGIWPQLVPGLNNLTLYSSSSAPTLSYKISYVNLYGGL